MRVPVPASRSSAAGGLPGRLAFSREPGHNPFMARRNYLKTRAAFRTTWTRRLFAASIIAACLLFLWSLIVGEMGVVKYYRMSAHARSLRSEIDRLKKDNERLSREVSALRSDPAYIERMARDKIGLALPGEVVYFYGDASR